MREPVTDGPPERRYPPISDYTLIGDSRVCALVSRAGSIDWLCMPDFDASSVFGRLLDWDHGGYWQIAPLGPYEVRRRYIDDTNVLETTFITSEGEVALIDLMPALREDEKRASLHPLRAVLRIVEGRRGSVRMRCTFEPRLDYGRVSPRLRQRGGPYDVTAERGIDVAHLRSDVPLLIDGGGVRAEFDADEGQRSRFSLAYSHGEPAVILSDTYVDWVCERSIEFWREWSKQCSYQGEHRAQVMRSALVLKLLAYAPSGAIIAAATTSLPEEIGGERNYDYRYCWLRDASFTTRVMLRLGLVAEARGFNAWLMHATHLTAPKLNPLYTLLGDPSIPERDLSHLEGYRGSKPVRIGNKASTQHQFDVYGELLNATSSYAMEAGKPLSRDEGAFLAGLANFVADHWREPDNGIWEQRLEPKHYTHSKAMSWLALASAAGLADEGRMRGDPERWWQEADSVRAVVLEEGYNKQIGAFTQTFGAQTLDASVLTLPLVGFIKGDDPRMISTIDVLRSKLAQDGFLMRYNAEDGMKGGEGAFVICNFWLAAALAMAHRLDEARKVFDATLVAQNDVGLMSEEYDPQTGEHLGNFPQAFSHIGLITAALAIDSEATPGRLPV